MWLKRSLEVAVFAKIFQAIRVQLCPLLCFPFSSRHLVMFHKSLKVGIGTLLWSWWGPQQRLAPGWLWSGEVSARPWVLQGRATMNPPWCSQQNEGRWQRNQPVSHGHTWAPRWGCPAPEKPQLPSLRRDCSNPSCKSQTSSQRIWIMCLVSHCNNGVSCYRTPSNTNCVWTLAWPCFEDRKRKYLLSHNTCYNKW